MATRYWTNASADGNFSTAGNWSGATTPVDGDTVIFDQTSGSITAGLDQSAKRFTLYVKRGYTGSIGSAGNPLLFGSTTSIEIDGGGGEIHLGTGATYAWTNVLISYPGVNGAGNVSLAATGGATLIAIMRGKVEYTAGTTTTCVLSTYAAGGGAPVLTVTGGTITTFDHVRGVAYQTAGTITTHRLTGGMFKTTGGTYTNLYQFAGTVIWNNTSTLTLLHGYSGVFDASQVAIARTITTANGFAGWTISKNDQVTITNNKTEAYGGAQRPYVGAPVLS